MKEGFFPNSNKIVKFDESENYWIFKTGSKIYKVKKREEVRSSVSLEEIFCNEISFQIQQHSPQLEACVLTIKKDNDQFVIDWNNELPSKALYYCISMNQLSDRGFLSNLVSKNKLTEASLKKVTKHLLDYHDKAKVSQSKEDGTPESLQYRLQDLYYQSKKYLGITISKAMIDMTLRPLERYLTENRKLFVRRIKQNRIRMIHGCYIPRKIHITNEGVSALGRTSDPLKNRYSDVAADISDLVTELQLSDMNDKAAYFIETYRDLSEDSEINDVLPIYQALRCLYLGLKYSIQTKEFLEQEKENAVCMAKKYYEHTIDVVRGL